MTTQLLGSPAPQRVRTVNRTRERMFFSFMALLMLATMLLGFRATYFPLGPKPPALASPVILLHGIVFTLFIGLYAAQTALISARRVRWHMSLGLAVYGLALVMVPTGIVSAADEIRRDLARGGPYFMNIDPLTFSIVSVNGMVMFGTLIAWSWLTRRRPDAHKRLALYATLSMMDAGIDRWPWAAWGIARHWTPWVYLGFLLLPVTYDLLSLRRVHGATMVAAPFVYTLHTLEIPVGSTAAWHAVANWMLRHLAG